MLKSFLLCTVPLLGVWGLVFLGVYQGSMDVMILGTFSGTHDILYGVILTFSYFISDRRKSYYAVVAWIVFLIFLASCSMQFIDKRPPGEVGIYDLYVDHAVMAAISLAHILTVLFLVTIKYIRKEARMYFLCGLMGVFLAYNFILCFKSTREMIGGYAMAYDVFLYLMLYPICISSNNYICDIIHSSYINLCRVLRSVYMGVPRA